MVALTVAMQKETRARLLCTGSSLMPGFYTTPWAIMASATFLKPAMFAPMT
ncbi:hypothetical protein HMPREF1219_00894 [Corynebacterium pyruviciproducens ATCC BAA-1742]|uniref:Uncharacterized protein n=1 Tax=Corynebacterium pyruviciproducens ATCC BAA-1742 TaxID=1125779 RepID=S3A0T2_9CORY|nr:hypothetical protein HMPREF1219_00894 [Corynebacterium pyruviciproducens ATCC BAA-1742]